MRYSTLLSAAVLAAGSMAAADEIRFARYPHAANDGRVAFCYHGDIWVAGPDGAEPHRLTAHIAADRFPRFSPDGEWIAFTSDRMGNDDLFVVPATGGEPRQLTFNTTGDEMLYWTPDGTGIVFASSRSANPWGSPLHIVPVEGGIPVAMKMDRGAAGMISHDGKHIAFNRNGMRYWRQGYRGNSNTDVYVQDNESGEIRQLTDLDVQEFRSHTQDAYPMWGADGMIYFMSERGGLFNIWRINPGGGGGAEQVTHHEGDGVQYPSISPDGSTIMYEAEFQLWSLDVPNGEPKHVPIEMTFDPKETLIEYLTANNSADGFAPSPDGEQLAVDYHGEIFIVPVDAETGEKTQVTDSPWRERNQIWSPDGRTIAYISDESREEEVWFYNVETKTRRKMTDQESTKSSLTWSPSSDRLLFEADNRLYLLDATDAGNGEITEIAHNPEGGFNGPTFSKDGRWLVYSRSDINLNSEVYLFSIESREEHNVTDHLARDRGGELTGDGKHVVFVSDRDDGVNHLYAVSLTPLREDPDDPMVRAKKAEEAANGNGNGNSRGRGGARGRRGGGGAAENASDDNNNDDDDNDNDEESEVKPIDVQIDLTDIKRRARRLTSGSDSVGGFFLGKDGQTIYFTRGGALHSIGVDGRDEKQVAEGGFGGMIVTAEGDHIFYRDGGAGGAGRGGRGGRGGGGGGIARMPVRGGRGEAVEFSFNVKVDHRAEWEQVFEEAWRVMKYRFYDENMHGVDWDAAKAHYKPMLKYVGENQDLYDLCNEMIGELNASHTGVSGPATRSMDRLYSTQSLGFEMAPDRDGRFYRITHIYRDGPADKEWLELSVGDYVLSIEGQELRAGDNYYPILNHLLNDYVDLEVASKNGNGTPEPRKVRVRAIGSTRNLQYEEWVQKNREFVDEQSGGKVGYVHIRSMNQSSLERFENEIDQYWNKNGMIIDIRYNGGGNIDQQLIDILERRPYEYWNSRNGGRAWGRRPRQAIAGPKVMLINHRSGSDSEVTPQGFRDLGLGRIVGNPTAGAVIATGSYGLLNGGSIRTPGSLVVTYDPTKEHNYGINLENFGVAPDVWVENTPRDEIAGYDRELKAAIDEALRMLAEDNWQWGEDD